MVTDRIPPKFQFGAPNQTPNFLIKQIPVETTCRRRLRPRIRRYEFLFQKTLFAMWKFNICLFLVLLFIKHFLFMTYFQI